MQQKQATTPTGRLLAVHVRIRVLEKPNRVTIIELLITTSLQDQSIMNGVAIFAEFELSCVVKWIYT